MSSLKTHLKELGVYTSFKKQRIPNANLQTNNIEFAFVWAETKEGYHFWKDVYDKIESMKERDKNEFFKEFDKQNRGTAKPV